mmetsp:Transcript_9895/g.17837  ORF Transcript_9895/g.17837 Transcript_9895/m.17837 type:complete len:93 (+) Transcript_9895:1207-1485(+)
MMQVSLVTAFVPQFIFEAKFDEQQIRLRVVVTSAVVVREKWAPAQEYIVSLDLGDSEVDVAVAVPLGVLDGGGGWKAGDGAMGNQSIDFVVK